MEQSKTLGDVLAEKAVLLKLEAGSQEAGFLSAFCSLENVPKLVIIRYCRCSYHSFSGN